MHIRITNKQQNRVPLSRARELLTEFKLDECQGLVKLLSDDPLDEQEDQLPVTTAADPSPGTESDHAYMPSP